MRKLINMTKEEIEDNILLIFEAINDLKFKEFMANSYAEKAIIREDIYRLETEIVNKRFFIKEFKQCENEKN